MWKIMCNTESEAKTKDWGYSFSVSFSVAADGHCDPGVWCVECNTTVTWWHKISWLSLAAAVSVWGWVWSRGSHSSVGLSHLRIVHIVQFGLDYENSKSDVCSALLSVVWYIIATKSPQLSSKHSHNRPGASYISVVRPCSFSTKLKTYTSEKRKFRKGGEGKMANQAHWQRWRTSSWPYLCTV